MSAPDPIVHTESIHFPFHGGARAAFLARPSGDGRFPGLIVIHELYGLNDNLRDITTRFARHGYAALAVDLFAGRNRPLCMLRLLSQFLVRSLDNASLSELRAALSHLAGQPFVDPARLGAVGYCLGGGFAVAWACTDARLRAIAPYYGVNPRPLDAVQRSCPVVGSYPEGDFTAKAGRRLDAALTRYAVAHDIKIYPGTKHSFFNDRGSAYHAAASEDSWRRVLRFFTEHLVNGPTSAAS